MAKDYRAKIDVKVTLSAVTPKTGLEKRGPYERNLRVLRGSQTKNLNEVEAADIQTAIDDAITRIGRQWPLQTAEPPEVETTPVVTVGTTTVTLVGRVHPHGVSTVITFLWGTNPANLNQTIGASQSPSSANAWTVVNRSRSGLTANTQYYYRIRCVAGTITVYSELRSFKTLAT